MRYVIRPGHGDDQIITDAHEASLEPVFQSEFLRLLRMGHGFVDVGAHVGHWTVRAALAGVRVVAVEPQPSVLDALRENCRCNSVQEYVQILPFAAWDSDTNVHLDLPTREEAVGQPPHIYGNVPDNCSGSVTVVDRPTGIRVPARPLDNLIHGYLLEPLAPGFVKIDVEGSEAHVLRGMEIILRSFRPHLIIEMHDCYYGQDIADQVASIMRDMDYGWVSIRQQGCPHWYMHAMPA